jgi:hypothetical protein
MWHGHEIHCHVFSLVVGNGCIAVYFVATKSIAALRDLLLVLGRYGLARHKERKEIYVVNGDNIPVTEHSWDDLELPPPMVRDIRTNTDGFLPAQSGMRHSAFRTDEDFCLSARQAAEKR